MISLSINLIYFKTPTLNRANGPFTVSDSRINQGVGFGRVTPLTRRHRKRAAPQMLAILSGYFPFRYPVLLKSPLLNHYECPHFIKSWTRDSTPCYVGRSVRLLVGPSVHPSVIFLNCASMPVLSVFIPITPYASPHSFSFRCSFIHSFIPSFV